MVDLNKENLFNIYNLRACGIYNLKNYEKKIKLFRVELNEKCEFLGSRFIKIEKCDSVYDSSKENI
jgi:hypothetical protein